MSIADLLAILWLHFIADFVLQTNNMAQNKSKSSYWLGLHCLVYGAPFVLFGVKFAAVNAIAHFVVDWVTSRINSRMWHAGRVHAFFVGVGADQAIHVSTLVLTFPLATRAWPW